MKKMEYVDFYRMWSIVLILLCSSFSTSAFSKIIECHVGETITLPYPEPPLGSVNAIGTIEIPNRDYMGGSGLEIKVFKYFPETVTVTVNYSYSYYSNYTHRTEVDKSTESYYIKCKPTKIELEKEIEIEAGDFYTIKYKTNPPNLEPIIEWVSSDEKVAEFQEKNKPELWANAEGTCIITARGNTGEVDPKCTVKVVDNYWVKPDVNSGIVDKGTIVTLTCTKANAIIYYTTDGNEPTKSSTKYTSPIVINKSMTLKAKAYVGDKESKVTTRNYTVYLHKLDEIFKAKTEEGVELTYKVCEHYMFGLGSSYYLQIGDGSSPAIDNSYFGPISIPESVDNMRVRAIANYAFKGANISSVFLHRYIEDIGINAFEGCKNLKELEIKHSSKIYISSEAFKDCILLEIIKNSGIKNEAGELVFINNRNNVSPSNRVFDNCNNIKAIYYDATNLYPFKNDNLFPNKVYTNATLYVRKGGQIGIKSKEGWKNFKKIKVIGDPEIPDISINSTNFPDANFRQYLLEQNYGEDGNLTDVEINSISRLSFISEGIENLKGIEYFTSLQYLDCSWNSVGTLDLSKNPKLKELTCVHCNLKSLDLSQNSNLEILDCSVNYIQGIEMDKLISSLPLKVHGEFRVIRSEGTHNVCTKSQVAAAKARGWTPYYYDITSNVWKEYKGSDEPYVTIDATNFPDANFRQYLLEQNYGKDGYITAEEVKEIKYLSLERKEINDLKGIEKFNALEYLFCSENQLTSLNVSNNTALETLSCGDNQISTLDVSRHTALKRLDCSKNQLTSLNVSNNTALEYLNCGDNQISSLDVSRNTDLITLYCYKNQLTSLNVSNNTALEYLSCGDNQISSLDVSRNTDLMTLFCSENQLTSLNVSNNTALEYLNCDDNQISSLDVSRNTALKRLVCYKNQLTSLNVSNNTALEDLSCNDNQISSLDVSRNTALKILFCNKNQLTSLNVSNNTALENLWCYDNKIKGEAMDALISSLPLRNMNNGKFYVVANPDNDGNVCTTIQVAAIKEKGWTPYYFNSGWVEYEGSEPTSEQVSHPEISSGKLIAWSSNLKSMSKDDKLSLIFLFHNTGSTANVITRLRIWDENMNPISKSDTLSTEFASNSDTFVSHDFLLSDFSPGNYYATIQYLEEWDSGKWLYYESQLLSFTVITTDIDKIEEKRCVDKNIYDIYGRKLIEPRKGINIIGGKKVFVK